MGYIDIKRLSLDELVGVVSLYPWFGGARRELCERMKGMGDDVWGESQFAEAAMYVPSREKMSVLMRSSRTSDLTDADVEDLIKSHSVVEKKVHVVGGDYFSQAEYDENALPPTIDEKGNCSKCGRYAMRAANGYCKTCINIYTKDWYIDWDGQVSIDGGW